MDTFIKSKMSLAKCSGTQFIVSVISDVIQYNLEEESPPWHQTAKEHFKIRVDNKDEPRV